jgi:hypothetical protein
MSIAQLITPEHSSIKKIYWILDQCFDEVCPNKKTQEEIEFLFQSLPNYY